MEAGLDGHQAPTGRPGFLGKGFPTRRRCPGCLDACNNLACKARVGLMTESMPCFVETRVPGTGDADSEAGPAVCGPVFHAAGWVVSVEVQGGEVLGDVPCDACVSPVPAERRHDGSVGSSETCSGTASEAEDGAAVPVGDAKDFVRGGNVAVEALCQRVPFADFAHRIQQLSDQLGCLGRAGKLESPKRQVVSTEHADRSTDQPARGSPATTALPAQGRIMEDDRDVEQLGRHGELFGRSIRESSEAGITLGARSTCAQQDKDRADPGYAGREKAAGVETRRSAGPACQVRHRNVEMPNRIEQVYPENLRVEQGAEAAAALAHVEPGLGTLLRRAGVRVGQAG